MTLDLEDEGDGLRSEINVTPLVDVMLVLLVIFMVVTPLLQRDVPVDLPLAVTGREAESPAQVTFTATAGGGILLDGEPVTDAALPERLRVSMRRARTARSSSQPTAVSRTVESSI
jgi:biopolymer transport protein ExbD